ncbi:hypothetical protein LCGC14_1078020 [marine sediment metagenome]|uniref:Methyltransferase type 11 domain-containing protein n=1 Tax=marine sediment metagenome TaxID=412755 RepID=A0A0F9MG77_9ZZZZ
MKAKASVIIKWLTRLLPDWVRPPLRYVYRFVMGFEWVRKLLIDTASLQECHDYWRNPPAIDSPTTYLAGNEISELFFGLVEKYVDRSGRMLEIGCSVGRNFNILNMGGYNNLYGIEICPESIGLLKNAFPVLAESCQVYNIPVEDIIKHLPYQGYDAVYTIAVLEHIHSDSEWIFADMARIIKDVLITIEDEVGVSCHTFPRNYKKIFEGLDMEQVEETNCKGIEGLSGSYVARVFRQRNGR